tara:strand:+ start:493 stop:807 length:315 start_codon:yes stop_codon:yes gene_type:complete
MLRRFVVLQDLINTDKDSLIEGLGIYGTKYYTKQPCECHMCGGHDINKIEVLGASSKPLLWICDECGEFFLMRSAIITEVLLTKAKCLYTNPEDWIGINSGPAN